MRLGGLSAGAVLLISADSPSTPTDGAAKAAVDVGHIFGQGGTDGLILYALILAVFLQFLALIIISILTSRERTRAAVERERLSDNCHAQAVEFASASRLAAEALKDAATAIASSASADMTFKQNMSGLLERLELALARFEAGGRK
jgi:hypothetical protein